MAWKLLTDRYDNKQFNVSCHLKAIFEQTLLNKDSSIGLRKMITDTKQHLRSLEGLNQPVASWDSIIIFLLNSKLDYSTRCEWELSKSGTDIPTLEDFFKFLERRCLALEVVQNDRVDKQRHSVKVAHAALKVNSHCKFCNGKHRIFQCDKFLKLTAAERYNTVRAADLCLNCLKFGHSVKVCNAALCKKCHKKHHTLIHQEFRARENQQADEITPNKINTQIDTQSSRIDNQTNVVALHNAIQPTQILLSTAMVCLQDNLGNWHTCRALLNSASQINFMTSELAKKLSLNIREDSNLLPVQGIGLTCTMVRRLTTTAVASNRNKFTKKLNFFVLKKITGKLPTQTIDINDITIPKDLQLAYPDFYEPSEIEVLLGGEIFLEILRYGPVKLGHNLPVLQNTVFGWILAGRIPTNLTNTSPNM